LSTVGLGPPPDWAGRDAVQRATDPPPPWLVGFRVVGRPAPQSGERGVATPAGYRMITTGGAGLLDWRHAVETEAQVQYLTHGTIEGAVGVDVTFRFALPQGRLVWERTVKDLPKVNAPDIDKLLRAVLDGLTCGGLIRDDRFVASVAARKVEVWDAWTGAEIFLRPIRRAREET
jgi:Holliday junction resolvase RusA-like endonuclease